MLAANGMLETLSGEKGTENYKNYNNDEDFGMVLEICAGDEIQKHALLYSDGQRKTFSFED